ncbi:hypothetical protein [Phreatobacter sp.]|uniref:hypothetical protein n=1 Tax=Phreatobacter sp. TaxID=1966341 RepID=UPI003F6E989B
MTHYDPRDIREPRPVDVDPATRDRHMPGSTNHPLSDPRLQASASGTGVMIVGGFAAALLLVFLVASMFGGPAERTAQAPSAPQMEQRAPTPAPPAPAAQPPAADPAVPAPNPPASQP